MGLSPQQRFFRSYKNNTASQTRSSSSTTWAYLTALAKTDLTGDLNYSEQNLVEKLFQTYPMRVGRFHGTWNDSQPSAERWLTAYTTYYN